MSGVLHMAKQLTYFYNYKYYYSIFVVDCGFCDNQLGRTNKIMSSHTYFHSRCKYDH